MDSCEVGVNGYMESVSNSVGTCEVWVSGDDFLVGVLVIEFICIFFLCFGFSFLGVGGRLIRLKRSSG